MTACLCATTADKLGVTEQEALEKDMQEKAKEFKEAGAVNAALIRTKRGFRRNK